MREVARQGQYLVMALRLDQQRARTDAADEALQACQMRLAGLARTEQVRRALEELCRGAGRAMLLAARHRMAADEGHFVAQRARSPVTDLNLRAAGVCHQALRSQVPGNLCH